MTPKQQPAETVIAEARALDPATAFLRCLSIRQTLKDLCALIETQMQRTARETVHGVHAN